MLFQTEPGSVILSFDTMYELFDNTNFGFRSQYFAERKTWSFIQTTHLIAQTKEDSQRQVSARRYKIPVVSRDFLAESVKAAKLQECDLWKIEKHEDLSLINVLMQKDNFPTVKQSGDYLIEKPYVRDEDTCYQTLRLFYMQNENSHFNVLELQAKINSTRGYNSASGIRIFHQAGKWDGPTVAVDREVLLEHQNILAILNEMERIRNELYNVGFVPINLINCNSQIGSVEAEKSWWNSLAKRGGARLLPPPVAEFVTTIFNATISFLSNRMKYTTPSASIIDTPAGNLSISQIEDAELLLLQMLPLVAQKDVSSKLQHLLVNFHKIMPWRFLSETELVTQIHKELEYCQLSKDLLALNEGLGSGNSWTEMRLAQLNCRLEALEESEISAITEKMNISETILRAFSLSRKDDEQRFTHDIGNNKLLFHGTKMHNLVGILIRGLILPPEIKAIQLNPHNKHIIRSDYGKLGLGIYFSDNFNLSRSFSDGYIFICEVTLGRTKVFRDSDPFLVQPPPNYNSVLGQNSEEGGDFPSDEYVIYNPCQARLKYILQVNPEIRVEKTQFVAATSSVSENLILKDLQEQFQDLSVSKPVEHDFHSPNGTEQKEFKLPGKTIGLVANIEGRVKLLSSHVRGRILDMVAEMVLIQEYENTSDQFLEAKYLFPIDENGAICQFEAYIGERRVEGIVKRRETARKEFSEAIVKGHGAYLMEESQEEDNVMTISIGNLPPKTRTIIKISYITELLLLNSAIALHVPALVGSRASLRAFHDKTQNVTDETFATKNGTTLFSLQISIDMPFRIMGLESPTHEIAVKLSRNKAMVQLPPGGNMNSDFELRVTTEYANSPRMFVEQSEKLQFTAMLSLIPAFPDSLTRPAIDNTVNYFVVDLSCSMSENAGIEEAKWAALQLLSNLPKRALVNLVQFGTTCLFLFGECQRLDTHGTQLHTSFSRMKPNLGGTDLMKAMSSLLTTASLESLAGRIVNLIVISDGQIHCAERIRNLVNEQKNASIRVFAIGVGEASYRHSLRSISHCAVFCIPAKQSFNRKVLAHLSHKLYMPSVCGLKVDWDTDASIVQSPEILPSLFEGDRLVVYASDCGPINSAKLMMGDEVVCCVYCPNLNFKTGDLIRKLAVRAMLRDFEGSENEWLERKEEMINTSIRENIPCKFTSFLAIDERENATSRKNITPTIDELLLGISPKDSLPYNVWKIVQNEREIFTENMVQFEREICTENVGVDQSGGEEESSTTQIFEEIQLQVTEGGANVDQNVPDGKNYCEKYDDDDEDCGEYGIMDPVMDRPRVQPCCDEPVLSCFEQSQLANEITVEDDLRFMRVDQERAPDKPLAEIASEIENSAVITVKMKPPLLGGKLFSHFVGGISQAQQPPDSPIVVNGFLSMEAYDSSGECTAEETKKRSSRDGKVTRSKSGSKPKRSRERADCKPISPTKVEKPETGYGASEKEKERYFSNQKAQLQLQKPHDGIMFSFAQIPASQTEQTEQTEHPPPPPPVCEPPPYEPANFNRRCQPMPQTTPVCESYDEMLHPCIDYSALEFNELEQHQHISLGVVFDKRSSQSTLHLSADPEIINVQFVVDILQYQHPLGYWEPKDWLSRDMITRISEWLDDAGVKSMPEFIRESAKLLFATAIAIVLLERTNSQHDVNIQLAVQRGREWIINWERENMHLAPYLELGTDWVTVSQRILIS